MVDKLLNEKLEFLRKIIIRDMTHIPEYIDTKNTQHKAAFKAYQELFVVISMLTTEEILSGKKIKYYILKTEEFLNDMLDSVGHNCSYMLLHSFIERTEQYTDYCVLFELYEAAENFKRFKEMYENR